MWFPEKFGQDKYKSANINLKPFKHSSSWFLSNYSSLSWSKSLWLRVCCLLSMMHFQLFSLISLGDYHKTFTRGNRSRWRRAIIWAWWESASGFQIINRLRDISVRQKVSEGKCLTEKWSLQLYMWHHLMRKDCVETSLAAWNTDENLKATMWYVEVTGSRPPSSLWCGQPLQLPFLHMCQT